VPWPKIGQYTRELNNNLRETIKVKIISIPLKSDYREQILPPELEKIRTLLHTHPQLLGLFQAAAIQNQNHEPESNLIQTDGHQQHVEIDHNQVRAQTQSNNHQDIENSSQNQSQNIAEVHTQISPQAQVQLQVRDKVIKIIFVCRWV
jgi:hypothetical protein